MDLGFSFQVKKMESKKMNGFDILKETLKVFANNFKFIIFTLLISLPLFFFSLYYENFFQKFLLQTTKYFQAKKQNPDAFFNTKINFDTNWFVPLEIVRNLNKDLFHELLHLGFLYLVPLHLLELITGFVIVDLASKIYREESSLTFKDMLHIRIDRAKLRGTIVTFAYVVFFSTSTLLGFLWLLITYSANLRYLSESDFNTRNYPPEFHFVIIRSYSHNLQSDLFNHLVYATHLLLLVSMYLVWSAIWNMSLVISVLEGIYGAKALGSSAYLSLRNAQNGITLMLVFSVWGVGLRLLPCLYFGGSYQTRPWVLVQVSLFCLGNGLKWVSFLVYFQDCLNRISRKKVVEEQGIQG